MAAGFAAAGLALDNISTRASFLGHELRAPLMIAPMTGGMELGAILNERWAKAAEHFGLAERSMALLGRLHENVSLTTG